MDDRDECGAWGAARLFAFVVALIVAAGACTVIAVHAGGGGPVGAEPNPNPTRRSTVTPRPSPGPTITARPAWTTSPAQHRGWASRCAESIRLSVQMYRWVIPAWVETCATSQAITTAAAGTPSPTVPPGYTPTSTRPAPAAPPQPGE